MSEGPRYTVEVSPAAARQLRKIDRQAARRITTALAGLQDDPRPAGCRAMAGQPGRVRIRIGDYRVVYAIEDDRLVVLVLVIGHRREVYRQP